MAQQNIELGPCRVTVDGSDVGPTLGPVCVAVRTLWRDRRSDRYGATITDRVAIGAEVAASFRVAEKTFENMQRALPGALAGDGTLGVGRSPGGKASASAAALRLHPEERGEDTGRDVVLHKAVATGELSAGYGAGGARAFDVEFVALLDAAQSDGDFLACFHQAD